MNILYNDFTQDLFTLHLPELNRHLYSKDAEIEIISPEGNKTIIPLAFTKDAKLHCIENGKMVDMYMGEF